MNYTLIIIVATALISIAGFSNESIINKLILWPRYMHNNPAEYYRLLTSGFIHADVMHLAFNMFSLYFFGEQVQFVFSSITGHGELLFILYLTGIIVSSLPSFLKNRNNSYYRSLGASGGVAAILFFTIYYFPWARLSFIIVPQLKIPAIVFGGLYLAYEYFMSKRGIGNVNHDAHFWGSVYGLFFAFAVDPTHGRWVIEKITNPSS